MAALQIALLVAAAIGPIPVAKTFAAGNNAVQLNGTNQYVTFGEAAGTGELGASVFTLELWFKRTGAGVGTGTGTGGITSAIPLISKGRAQAETPLNLNMNYFFGIDSGTGTLVADFEDTINGGNHPAAGTAVITSNVWHHAAVTYTGSTYTFYLDGALDRTVDLGTAFVPEATSLQHAGVGTAMTSAGVAAGFFQGVVDEPRIWNVARSLGQIQAAKNLELGPQAGLIGLWHFNDGSGTVAVDASGRGNNGTLTPTATPPGWVTGFDVTNAGVQLNGTTQYVTFGEAAGTGELGASVFTLELWFKRTGAGVGTGTGTGGITSAIPLISKGRAQAETPLNLNMNYFFGIDSGTGTLVADFEDTINGGNHPAAGTAVITSNVWHHAAVTYTGSTYTFYLDGALDRTVDLGTAFVPEATSLQHAGVGTAMTSAGVAAGFFQGVVDEPRIWNVARSLGQIQTAKNLELGPQAGLIGLWHFNDGSGTAAVDASGRGNNGTLTPTATPPLWVDGFVPPSAPPSAPVLTAPGNGSTGIVTPPTLDVVVSDPDNATVNVSFFGRPLASGVFGLVGSATGIASGAHATTSWTGLGGGQTYEWFATVSDGTTTTTGPTWTFHTAGETDPVLVGVGDIGSCLVTGDEATAAVMAGVDGPIFTTGDNVYPDGRLSEFMACYDPAWGPFKTRTRPVPGNHDWNTGNLDGYNAYFGANATDANGQSYYSYDIGSLWHVVNLDSECARVPGGCGDGSAQEVWLAGDLAANSTKNVIAVWHKPRFSSGSTNLTELQPLIDDLYAAGVDIALVGHDHIYERFQPLDANGAHDPVFGIKHFTVGTGGEAHHTAGTPEPTSEALDDNTFGIFKLTLHPTSFDWKFLPIAGETFTDSGTASVHDAPNGSPVAVDDGYTTPQDTTLVVDAPGVLANDIDTDPLTVAVVADPTHGVLALAADGGFTYTPDAGYSGSDSFTYEASDATVDSNPATVRITVGAGAGTGVALDGANGHVTFGPAIGPTTGLGASQFTLELWFRRTGAGLGTSTGTGGVANAIPLITKGRAEMDAPANLNMNYFLGIDATTGTLVADFEDAATGGNHPVIGTAVVTSNVWHHVAVTYSGSTWNLYLDGALDKTLTLGSAFVPEASSIQHAGLGTAMTSDGTAAGFFQGVIDEARIWNVARSLAQIQGSKNVEVGSPTAGLRGRWGLNEGSGTNAPDSSGRGMTGTLVGGPAWVPGFVPPVGPPTVSLDSPSDGAIGTTTSPTLAVTGTDPDDLPVDVQFFGRTAASGNFALIATNSNVPSGTSTSTVWTGRNDGQRYEWFVTVDDGTSTTTSPTWTFNTAPGTDPVLVGAGDIADCGRTQDEATAAVIDGIAGTIFTTGDNVYPNGTPTEFATCYDASWGGSIKARTRPAPGNHDWNAGNLNGYNGYFGPSATDADGKSYYSFDIGSAWHVTVLDSECAMVTGGCVSTSPQVDWLRADLAANSSRNVIIVFHKPRFSSAVTNLAAMQPFWDVSYQYGVDIILVGHDHVYERFAPMAPNGTADPTFGIRQFTVGTGGAAAQSFGTILPTSQVRSPSQTYGVMKLTLHATTYDWLFLPISGSTFTDSGTGSVHAAPNGEPTFDQNLPNRTDAEGVLIDLDAGATDPNSDPLTYEASNLPTGLSIDASTGRITGTIAFTAAAGSPYAVSITVRDGPGVDDTDTFTWTVTDLNQPPTASATSATTNEEVPVAIALSGSDPDTCELTFSIVTSPTKGSLGSISGATCVAGAPNTDSASVTYTPSLNATGADSFTYRVFDGTTNSAPVTASLTISAVEDLPTATGATGSTTTNEDTALGLTVRGTDAETCNLTFNLPATTAQGGTLGASSPVACVAGNPNADTATLTYTPPLNYNGPDSFSYTVTDAAAGTSLAATVNLTVTAVNDLPSATGASGPTTTAEDTALGLTLGGTDPETCNLTFNVPASTTHGTLSVPSLVACTAGTPNSDTTGVTYTPAAHYFGPDSFSYTVTDGATGTSVAATVNLTVTAVNDGPTANAGSASTTTGSPVVISLAGSDRETCELTFSTPATTAQGGTLGSTSPLACSAGSLNTDTATLTYTPPAAYSGPDSFTFTVSDGTVPSAPATISITVGPGGGSTTTTFPATADGQVYSSQPTTNYGTLSSMRTREGTGAASSPIYRSYVRFTISGLSGPVSDVKLRLWVTDASADQQQVLAVSPDTWIESGPGSLTYNTVPTTDPPGTPLGSAPAPATGAWVEIDLANSAVGGDGPVSFLIRSAGTNSFIFNTKEAATNRPELVVTAGSGGPPNTLPSATGASGPTTTAEDTALGLTLGGTDPETCNLTFNVPASTTHGTLSAPSAIACTAGTPNSDTTGVTYTPAAHYFGPDSFSYTVTDGATGTSVAATVNLTVTAVNDGPTANAGSASTTTGSPVVISLAGSDRETCELTFSTPATTAQGGTLGSTSPLACSAGSLNTDTATLTYTPPAAYSGPDSFTFTVSDGTVPSAPATISITVGPGGGSTTTTFPATADGQVYSSQPTTNYGTLSSMRTREGTGAASSPIYRSYVRFTISGLSGPVSDVKLRLWVTDASADQQQVLAVSPDTWIESGPGSLTYNTVPTTDPPGTPLGSAPAPATGAWVEIDLANSAVGGDGPVSFLIRSAGTNSFIFNTKEAATNRPELVVTAGSGGPPNTLPSATGASGPTTTAEDTALGLTLGGTDPETCNLTFNVPASTTHGTLSAPSAIACTAGTPNSDTTGVTYTPAAHYFGPDSFSYTVTDGATGTSVAATVNLTVTAVNDGPTANAGSASTTTGSPVVISLAGSDRETCELTFSTPATTAQGGTLGATSPLACSAGSLNTDTATLTYTPPAAYSGPDSFTFTVSDGTVPSAPATISITVGPGGGSTTTTFPATADGQVYSSQPTTNYGTLSSMRTREGTGAASSPIYRSYVRFTISGLSGPVSDVKLRLWVTDASADQQQVLAVSPDTWIESGPGSLTYNTVPTTDPPGTPLGSAPAPATGAWVEIDLANSAVGGDGPVSFLIRSAGTNSFIFNTKEAATNRPELVVTAGSGTTGIAVAYASPGTFSCDIVQPVVSSQVAKLMGEDPEVRLVANARGDAGVATASGGQEAGAPSASATALIADDAVAAAVVRVDADGRASVAAGSASGVALAVYRFGSLTDVAIPSPRRSIGSSCPTKASVALAPAARGRVRRSIARCRPRDPRGPP